ncbi:MAG: peptidase M16 [Bacteroidetes bacterium HGW-Bacteroidetes-7]|jgi:predicted Zn-dependent peptidase|nr:MAG: peptidase M16 [Bacteroidetes bacterium HGW-Bacteroidetes-7]
MMKRACFLIITLLSFTGIFAQGEVSPTIKTVEYNLKNGLHVIIYQDNTSPIVNVGVMYHVGSKNERPDRTGFAHLFEHLLFNGTKNIPEGELEYYLREAGGYSNANTSADRTYYYTILPSHQLNLGLWIESERMLHPVISEKVIAREREVVKEESRQRYDVNPLGRIPEKMQAIDHENYSYRWPVIGSMEHLDAASLDDFKDFFDRYYIPNNACLVITGDVDIAEAKKYIKAYFERIPKGKSVIHPQYISATSESRIIRDSIKGIKDPHIVISYKAVPETHQDAVVLDFINSHLTFTGSNPLNEITKNHPGILKVASSKELYEMAGNMWFRSSYKDTLKYDYVVETIQNQLNNLANNGLDEKRLSQLKHSYQSGYTDMFYDMAFLADMLAISYLEWGTTQRVNNLIPSVKAITNEDIMKVTKKYFTPDNRKILLIYPKK